MSQLIPEKISMRLAEQSDALPISIFLKKMNTLNTLN